MRNLRRRLGLAGLIFSFLLVMMFPGNMRIAVAKTENDFLPLEDATISINVKIRYDEKQELMQLFGQDAQPDFSKHGIIKARPVGAVKGKDRSLSQTKRDAWWNLEIPKYADPQEYINKIAEMPGVVYVEANREMKLFETDPRIGEQWHLQAIHAAEGWSYLAEQAPDLSDRDEVIVAVIDSGVQSSHEDLADSLWTNQGEIPGNGLDDDGNGYIDDVNGWNTYDNNNNIADVNGHGTHVAGIIAATKDNGLGVAGVAPNVKIMTIRASSTSGTLTSYTVANGVYYALANGADVINMSFGGYYESQMEQEVYLQAKDQAVLVAAAGNETRPTSSAYSYPAAYPYVLGVMAASQTPNASGDYLSGFSNWDTDPSDDWGYEVMAPGERILSTVFNSNSSYDFKSGTSMATPVVAGVAALVKSRYADDASMGPQDIQNLIVQTGLMKQGKTDRGIIYEYPYVDVEQALKGIVQTPDPVLHYQGHVQNIGWQPVVTDGALCGTTGQALRLEALRIHADNLPGSIEYRTFVNGSGWTEYFKDGQTGGTTGLSLPLEALELRLTGVAADLYDLYYRVHAENFGWLGWAKNGQSAGTSGYGFRVEAMEAVLVEKGGNPPGTPLDPFKDKALLKETIHYQAHVQDVGWQDYVKDSDVSGTTGQALRLEGIRIGLENIFGGIVYRTHVQNIGWMSFVSDGQMSGTEGQSLRLEAVEIQLYGPAALSYDVYYRTHIQNYGWLGWAKNGAPSGSAGFAYRMEAMQIVLVPKGGPAPGTTANTFLQK